MQFSTKRNGLQSSVNDFSVQECLDIENHMPVFQKRTDIKVFELPVGDGKDGCVELVCWQFVGDFDAVLVPYYVRIGPWVVYRDVDIVLLQSPVDVYDLGVAHVRAVFLESESEDEDVGVKYLKAFF